MISESNLPTDYKLTVDWASITVKRFGKSLVKNKVAGTELAASFRYQVINGSDGPQKVVFTYLKSGKFVDMGVGRGQKLGDVKGNKSLYGALGLQGRKAKKWYSKTITSESKRLAELLAELYGKSMIAVVNDNIPDQINISL